MSLLDWRQLAVVAAPVNSFGIGGALEILLKRTFKLHQTNGPLILLTLFTQFLRPSGIRLIMARLTSLAAISRSSIDAASL